MFAAIGELLPVRHISCLRVGLSRDVPRPGDHADLDRVRDLGAERRDVLLIPTDDRLKWDDVLGIRMHTLVQGFKVPLDFQP